MAKQSLIFKDSKDSCSVINGFLNLHKPRGITAHDCISRVRKLLNQKKVGHSGTLDPMATGVLPIAIGNCTRLLRFLPEGKAYKATIRFGIITNTDDMEGEILTQKECPDLKLIDIERLLPLFQGTIQQRPPAFSAIQVNGVRLYDLARAGLPVEVPIRTVEVYKIEVLAWRSGSFPELDLMIACGSGTYIRAIARDLGELLKCGATLSGLERTFSNGFDLIDSKTFTEIAQIPETSEPSHGLISADAALQNLAMIELPIDAAKRWTQGQALSTNQYSRYISLDSNLSSASTSGNNYRRIYAQAQFLGVGEIHVDQLIPVVVLETQLLSQ
ncbi:tRNA pseudouridine 55 synthase [Synechococcus sp. PCC 7502]|uniref:tRNA pseudouridine(55) synthase TruB n=1 Tax=Synechococcus sp. PCC 7502 TaxID=1173263 RepID=UPI00029FD9C7|nr:tRNA pseudouridine(55) synthase TruB [Synechococcus sp. PCC 7502]AFY74046.1 tRNA pseudouridine 55 synthase [Synechococcus sp. PCC 7502]